MGYYVQITDCSVFLPKELCDDAYKALCDLNQHDEPKTGGSYGGIDTLNASDPRPEGMTYHPARWFSWMDADYPSKCKTLEEVLQEVGFDPYFDADGNLESLLYDSKTGCEEIFLTALAPFMRGGSYINWRGEEGELYRYEFQEGQMRQLTGNVTYS
jgi:hypothetical protein